MAVPTLRGVVGMAFRALNAEQLTKEVRSIAPFLVPFLKMTCIYFILWLDQGSFPAAFIKCLPLLSLIWFVCLLGISDRQAHRYNRMILTALVLCCAGDFFLVWGDVNEAFFLLGLGFFGVGHIVYSFAFGWRPFGLKEFLFTFSLGLPLVAGVLSYLEGPLFYPSLAYGLVLIIMEWRALARFNLRGDIPWRKIFAACGATLFVFSDTVLAINKFCWPVVGERSIVMVTYYAAQLCISLSVVNSNLVHPAPRGVATGNHQKLLKSDGGVKVQDGMDNVTKKNHGSLQLNRTAVHSTKCSNTDDVIHNTDDVMQHAFQRNEMPQTVSDPPTSSD